MPADQRDLDRGAVCLALFPFSPTFPLEEVLRSDAAAQLEAELREHDDVEAMSATISAGSAPEVVTQLKLRRVLLLQDVRASGRADVTVAKISSVSEHQRSGRSGGAYKKLVAGTHPAMLLLDHPHHGVTKECYISLWSVTTINRNTILRKTGQLTEKEMLAVSDRLVTTLELDISERLAALRG